MLIVYISTSLGPFVFFADLLTRYYTLLAGHCNVTDTGAYSQHYRTVISRVTYVYRPPTLGVPLTVFATSRPCVVPIYRQRRCAITCWMTFDRIHPADATTSQQ